MKVSAYTNKKINKEEFQILNELTLKTVRAYANVSLSSNDTFWTFKHEQNGVTKHFPSWEAGLEYLESKGW